MLFRSAIRDISHDMTCRRKVRLANGREVSALDIQREYLDRALRYADSKGFPPMEQKALEMWEHCVSTIENDPLKLDREVDWVIKYRLLEAFRARHGLTLGDARVQLLDLQYHDICRDRSPFYKLQDRGMIERMCLDTDIETAIETPPQNTRARLRGEFIKRAKERKRDYTVDWVHLKLNDQAQRTVLCKDPFRSRDERVAKLIASLGRTTGGVGRAPGGGSVTPMSDPPRRTEIDDLLDSAGVVLHEPADTDLHPAPADLEWGAEAGSADSTDPPATDVEPGDDADHTPAAPTRPRKSVAAAMIEWLVVVAVAVTAALLVKAYVVQQFQVSGDSMRMTLHDGDRVLVNKLSYRMHDPNRGDVVVLKTIESVGERDLIKRVVALPGETVEYRSCVLYIDGKELVEPYLDPNVVTPTNCGGDQPPLEVPKDAVYVLGDNRGGSKDSRDLGPIEYDDIIGRAFVVIWPAGDWRWL